MMTIKFLSDRRKPQTEVGLSKFSFLGQTHAGTHTPGPTGAVYNASVGRIPVNRHARLMNTSKGMAQVWKMWYTKIYCGLIATTD